MSKVQYLKNPTTFEEQLELLERRGLSITNRTAALEILSSKNYYRLGAYGLTYQNEDKFELGTTFGDICGLYQFDKQLRSALLCCLEDIEIALRTRIAYTFAHECGALGYTDPKNFKTQEYHAQMLEDIDNQLRHSRELFVKHHREKYGGFLPVWVVVETMSFGAVSRLFSNLRRTIAKKVAADFYEVPYFYLINWIHGLSVLRNICAHYGRIYNRPFTYALSLMKYQQKLDVQANSVFAFVLVMGHMLNYGETWLEFLSLFDHLLDQYGQVELKYIGFPENWWEILMAQSGSLCVGEAAASKEDTQFS